MKYDKLILASGSPRRQELLQQMGLTFSIEKANGEEVPKGDSPGEIVEHLARQKAKEVALGHQEMEMAVVIGADTIVVWNHQVLGKPRTQQEAFQMIKNLQGGMHQVYTGVSLFRADTNSVVEITSFYESTNVWVHKMNDSEIQNYVNTGEAFDKAGAYGIQGRFGVFIDRIEGDFYNVMGLPIAALYQRLRKD